jgi:hypothetical protein
MKGVTMFGNIVRVRKGFTYNKTRQPWGHVVIYEVLFYKDGDKVLGWVGDNKPFTFDKHFRKKSELKKFLKDCGYFDYTIEGE